MGLIQNEIEGAGITTISMTVQPHITATVGVPRAINMKFPAGNQVGEAGKPIQQRTILTEALQAALEIETPGTILDLPYRWRRYPIVEEPVLKGASTGPRHTQAEALGPALDDLVGLIQDYRIYLECKLEEATANGTPSTGIDRALRTQIGRVQRLNEILDTEALDSLREVVNSIATLELRASGKFV